MRSGQMAPLTRDVFELIGYDWAPANDIMRKARDLVPPGRAVRKHDSEVAARARKSGPAANPRAVSDDEKVALGGKRVIEHVFGALRKQKHIEVEWRGDVRYIRRAPFTLAPHDVEPFTRRIDAILSGTDVSLPQKILLMPMSERKALVAAIAGALDPREEAATT